MPAEAEKSKKHRESRIRKKDAKRRGVERGQGWETSTYSQQKQEQGTQDSEDENSSSLDVARHPPGPLTYSLSVYSSEHVCPSVKHGRPGYLACESDQGGRASAPHQVGVD